MRASVWKWAFPLMGVCLWFCQSTPPLAQETQHPNADLATFKMELPPFPQDLVFEESVQKRLQNAYREIVDPSSSAKVVGQASEFLHAHHLESLALPGYLKAFGKEPKDFRWAYLAGVTAKASGLDEVSKSAFATARILNPSHAPSGIEWAEFALQENRHDEARAVYEGILASDTGNTMALWGLGQIELAQGSYAEAADLFERVLANDGNATMVYYSLAQAQQALGETEKARQSLEKRGNGRPSMPDAIMESILAKEVTVVGFRRAADRALRAGSYGEALNFYGEALALDSEDSLSYLNRGWAHAYQKDLVSARKDWNRVLTISGQPILQAQACFNLGEVEQWENNPLQATVQYEKALKLHPGFYVAKLALAEVLRGTEQFGKAEAIYQAMVIQNPGDPIPRLGRALCRIRLQEFEAALNGLNEDVAAQPDQATFFHIRIRILVTVPDENLRDGNAALAMFEQLTQGWRILDSGLAETGAMVLAEQGRFQDAMRLQQRALAMAREEGEPKQTEDRLLRNLEEYLNQRPCRVAWPDDAAIFTQPLRQAKPLLASSDTQN